MSALLFVAPDTARVHRLQDGRRFLTRDAAYLAAARRRAHEIAEHGEGLSHEDAGRHYSDVCRCRVCGWRDRAEAGRGDWKNPPELLRYAAKMRAHDKVLARELELLPSPVCQRAIDAVKAAHLAVTGLGPEDRRRFDREIERWAKAKERTADEAEEVA